MKDNSLQIANTRDAVAGLDDDEKLMSVLPTSGQSREMNIISESGLYSLIFKSRKPEAKIFRRWVTHDVLPAIRKTGSYSIPSKKVQVDHNHKRTSNNPGGLDIRYNLDLTKAISKPTRAGLEILERLTGITFADIDLGENSLDDRNIFQMFVEHSCIVEDGGRIHSTELYRLYLEWSDPELAMTVKKFHNIARGYFTRVKSSGIWFYKGLKINSVEKS